METFEVSISGTITIQAEGLKDIVREVDKVLNGVLDEWQVEDIDTL
jgi:hypothetical protein